MIFFMHNELFFMEQYKPYCGPILPLHLGPTYVLDAGSCDSSSWVPAHQPFSVCLVSISEHAPAWLSPRHDEYAEMER